MHQNPYFVFRVACHITVPSGRTHSNHMHSYYSFSNRNISLNILQADRCNNWIAKKYPLVTSVFLNQNCIVPKKLVFGEHSSIFFIVAIAFLYTIWKLNTTTTIIDSLSFQIDRSAFSYWPNLSFNLHYSGSDCHWKWGQKNRMLLWVLICFTCKKQLSEN